MKIAREEIFGPVLAVMRFDEPEEAIAIANSTTYGLVSAVWTRDIRLAHRVAAALKAGSVWINTYNAFDPASPVRRLQAKRLRPRPGLLRPGAIHQREVRLGRAIGSRNGVGLH